MSQDRKSSSGGFELNMYFPILFCSVRCIRRNFTCQKGDLECLNAPLSLSYNFLTFPTNVKTPTDLFSMSGPLSDVTQFDWSMDVTSISASQFVRRAEKGDFYLRTGPNNASVSLERRVEGPQDVELRLTMEITDLASGYKGYALSKIYLYITPEKIV